ncbi:hypothetical protein IFM89_003560, partial [Coptis chinensis]
MDGNLVLLLLDLGFHGGWRNGVSSFNEFIHEISVDSDSSSIDYASNEEYYDESMSSTPQSQDSRVSRASSFYKSSTAPSTSGSTQPPHVHSSMKFNFIKDHIIHHTTDRRRGVVKDFQLAIEIFIESLTTDARTCQDVITELGYPYEAISVVTSNGYVLLLERILRRDARKVVYLQHEIMDSSMGWVSNGVVGSPAFAAFDQ